MFMVEKTFPRGKIKGVNELKEENGRVLGDLSKINTGTENHRQKANKKRVRRTLWEERDLAHQAGKN